VQVAGAIWRAATRIVVGVGDLVQRTGDSHTGRVLGGRTIERLGDDVCGPHRASSHRVGFSWFGLNNGGNGFSQFGLKIGCSGFPFGRQNSQLRFCDLCRKITAIVSCFGPQNQAGYCLLVASQNR
jgi:hypothetical protein